MLGIVGKFMLTFVCAQIVCHIHFVRNHTDFTAGRNKTLSYFEINQIIDIVPPYITEVQEIMKKIQTYFIIKIEL